MNPRTTDLNASAQADEAVLLGFRGCSLLALPDFFHRTLLVSADGMAFQGCTQSMHAVALL